MHQHKTQELLLTELKQANSKVKVGAVYVHYKKPDHHYLVKELAIVEETEKIAVIYQALYDHNLTFIRSLENWLETVMVNGKPIPRFTLISSEVSQQK